MKKLYYLFAVLAIPALIITSCVVDNQPNTPYYRPGDEPIDTVVPVDTTVVPVDTPIVPVDTTVTPIDTTDTSSFVSGAFSVSAYQQVRFAPGNLQFNAALGTHQCADGTTQKGTWRFAEHQWDYVGDASNGNVYHNGTKCDNANISETYDGWIDLFGWGTSGWGYEAVAYEPWSISTTESDYYRGGNENNDLTGAYANADWGVYNQIGSDAPGTWRTLTADEWLYLFHERANAEKLFGLGSVNGVNGTIILPDDWVTPSGLSFTPSTESGLSWKSSYYSNPNCTNFFHNTYTESQWAQMEARGAVFLPAAGGREGTWVYDVGSNGGFWSSASRTNITCTLGFHSSYLTPQAISSRYTGFSLRLVSVL